MQIDFHVHSKYSRRPSQWILQKISCPESFTEPIRLYQIAKQRGMTHVTITDHNAIEGALTIAHLPDTFISEEITTYFPDDGCKLHVLALHIDEKQHAEIQKIRENIFDLTAYLKEQKIFNIVAHPLYAINDRLTLAHIEKILLLFNNLELNGSRNNRENRILQQVVASLAPQRMEEFANRQNLAPLYLNPWQKRLLAGSDDHSSLNIARSYTQVIGAANPEAFFSDPDGSRLKVVAVAATPQTMAHNLYGIAYQYYRNRLHLERYADKDMLIRFLDRALGSDQVEAAGVFSKLYCLWNHRRSRRSEKPVSDSLISILRHETRRLIQDLPDLLPDAANEEENFKAREERWFKFVSQLTNRIIRHFADHLMGHLSGAKVFNIFQSIGSAGGVYALLAPYFVAFSIYNKDRTLGEQVTRSWVAGAAQHRSGAHPRPIRVAHFTDTFYEVNGVALTLQQHVQMAIKNDKALTIITCSREQHDDLPGVKHFKPVGVWELPEYPEQNIFYPPLLEMIAFCYAEKITHIHTATPGPIGLAALAVARILKLPISGTYHTAIPQYAQALTNDEAIEDLTWKYILWYYGQLDTIYAPSDSTRRELVTKGLMAHKIRIYPRGIDIDCFHPRKRNGLLKSNYNITAGTKLLYVGRVSKEKNLYLLAEAYRQLIRVCPDTHLVITGDGPYLSEMKTTMSDLPCTFTGYLRGEALATVYASCDIFVFPSTTDTFGNVVLEAQASGLPVIVTDQGGPCENVIPAETGLVVAGNDIPALLQALQTLVQNRSLARQMGKQGRAYMRRRSFEAAFMETWQLYHQNQGCRSERMDPARAV